jgi:Zn-dependent peptidase ImmA (M78 family)/transcriptional regulator with XRE-family HTH domain
MPGIPDRVRDLVRASELSQHAFAERIGIDASKLSKSLSGARRFSSVDLARIAELCDVTVDWLVTGEDPPLAVAARTTGGSAGAAVRAARRYSTLRTDMAALGYRQPWGALDVGLSGRWAEQGGRLAAAALARVMAAGGSVGGTDLPALVEDVFGADVAVENLGSGFDGLAASSDDVKLIVLATSQVVARQRFTLAHELGHLLAGDDQGLHLDRDVFDKAQGRDPSEQRANAFAASFLMPQDALRSAVGSVGLSAEGFAELTCDLVVTPSALAYRLLHLRLIDAGTCERYKSLTGARAASLAGRGEEFARLVAVANAPRSPGLLVRDTYAAYESGAATLRGYANLIGADVDALREALEAGSADAS